MCRFLGGKTMRKQPERTAKTKRALVDAFWTLYEETPIEKITVRQITESAGVYRSTFYEYFSDVYAVREFIEKDILDAYEVLVNKATGIDSLDEGMALLIDFYSNNAKYLAVLWGPHGDQQFLNNVKRMINAKLRFLFSLPFDDPEIDILIEMMLSSVISLLNYWYVHRDKMTIREVIDVGSQFFQEGLFAFLKERGINIFKIDL